MLHHRDHVLDRPLDVAAVGGCAVEVFDEKIVVNSGLTSYRCLRRMSPSCFGTGRQVVAHEEAVDFAGEVLGGDRLLEDDVQDVDAIEVARPAEERLRGVVVLLGVHFEGQVVEVPPGEGAEPLRERLAPSSCPRPW